MKKIDNSTQSGHHYSATQLGPLDQLERFTYEAPTQKRRFVVEGKVFLGQLLGLTSCEISLNFLPPSAGIPFYHKHQNNEEVYIAIQGQGEFQIDGEILEFCPGTALRVAPAGERTLRNISTTEPLIWFVVQAPAGQYPQLASEISDGVGIPKPVVWPASQ